MAKVSLVDTSGDYVRCENGELARRHGGLGWVIAAFFIVADLSGSGIVAIPKTIAETGYWFGMVSLLMVTLIMLCSGILLGQSWNLMLQNYPTYRSYCRKPYTEMGYRVGGTPLRIVATICMFITNFGAAVVFLILCAKNINDFFASVFGRDPGQCLMIGALAFCILPITLLKSPQNFPGIVTIGMSATILAMSAICIGSIMDLSVCSTRQFTDLKLSKVWVMLGTLMFSYGGHGTFPTIQHDMSYPAQFTKSSYLSFGIIFALYALVAAVGGYVYGDSLGDSIINSIQTKTIQQAINLLIMLHCFLTTTLILNPVNQEVEDVFRVPHDSVAKRIITRCFVMFLATLTALLNPTFNLILGVIGGSTIMLTSLLLPALYYLFLSFEEKPISEYITTPPENLILKHWRRKSIRTTFSSALFRILRGERMKTTCICGFIIVFGLISGTAATYTSLVELFSNSGMKTCFWGSSGWEMGSSIPTRPCGKFHNISSYNS